MAIASVLIGGWVAFALIVAISTIARSKLTPAQRIDEKWEAICAEIENLSVASLSQLNRDTKHSEIADLAWGELALRRRPGNRAE